MVPHRDCNQLFATGLSDYFTKSVSLDQMRIWVAQEFRVPDSNIRVDQVFQTISWNVGKIYYTINFTGSVLDGLHIDYSGQGPVMQDLITCLGQPDSYSAISSRGVERYQFNVDLFWQEQGIIVSGVKLYFFAPSQTSLRVNSTFEFKILNQVKPGALAEIFPAINPAHSWPEDGHSLVVDFK